jgi:hypothetical protein
MSLTTIECLKCIIKCLYKLVFKFDQLLDFKMTYLLNYWVFCDFDPFAGLFSSSGIIFHYLGLNKWNLTAIEGLKCILKCLYQFVFKFSQFLDFQLAYLLNYCRFCNFGPFTGHFSPFGAIFHNLRLNERSLTTIACLKCIRKCLYQVVFKFSQFFYFQLAH